MTAQPAQKGKSAVDLDRALQFLLQAGAAHKASSPATSPAELPPGPEAEVPKAVREAWVEETKEASLWVAARIQQAEAKLKGALESRAIFERIVEAETARVLVLKDLFRRLFDAPIVNPKPW